MTSLSTDPAPPAAEMSAPKPVSRLPSFLRSEDWWAIWLGMIILGVSFYATVNNRPANFSEQKSQYEALTQNYDVLVKSGEATPEELSALKKERDAGFQKLASNPLKPWVAKLSTWVENPLAAFYSKSQASLIPGILGVFVAFALLFGFGQTVMGHSPIRFLVGFIAVFALAVVSFVLAGQAVVKEYNLEYALWAIVLGLLISNTIGTPAFMKPALLTEFFIKTGLVLLGAEILFSKLLALGVPGIGVSWVTTPITLISTFIFGQKILKMASPSLNMVISADMSVCGVSAAIATGAACRAKKEELSLAIALSLGFTVIMMVAMPAFIKAVDMDPVIAGAWIGGTIDSTGAVGAAGGMIGEEAMIVAMTVKMIQNILIGVIAFAVSIYWVGWVERSENQQRVSIFEIWRRFPKFMLGFVAASLIFSYISSSGIESEAEVQAMLTGTTETLRGWLFCLAFVSIGLESNFKEFLPYFKGGKPLILYVVGQSINLVLTLVMAWIMFTKIFPNAADVLKS